MLSIYITSSAEVIVNGNNKAIFNPALQSNSDYRIFTLYTRRPRTFYLVDIKGYMYM